MTKIYLKKIALIFFFLYLLLVFPAFAQSGVNVPIVSNNNFPDAFLNQNYRYNISFLWFNDAAEGHFFFERGNKPNEYRSVLEINTKGFIGWLTSYRKYKYESVMDIRKTQKGRRLISRFFQQDIFWGKNRKTTSFRIDYSKGVITNIDTSTGGNTEVVEHNIPENVIYEDLLSAYYNFKGGVFGYYKKGDVFEIDTLPRKGVSKIKVTIADEDTERAMGQNFNGSAFLVRLDVDRRLFGQKGGIVWVWLDRNLVPLMGNVKDVLGYGDVWGVIKNKPSDSRQ